MNLPEGIEMNINGKKIITLNQRGKDVWPQVITNDFLRLTVFHRNIETVNSKNLKEFSVRNGYTSISCGDNKTLLVPFDLIHALNLSLERSKALTAPAQSLRVALAFLVYSSKETWNCDGKTSRDFFSARLGREFTGPNRKFEILNIVNSLVFLGASKEQNKKFIDSFVNSLMGDKLPRIFDTYEALLETEMRSTSIPSFDVTDFISTYSKFVIKLMKIESISSRVFKDPSLNISARVILKQINNNLMLDIRRQLDRGVSSTVFAKALQVKKLPDQVDCNFVYDVIRGLDISERSMIRRSKSIYYIARGIHGSFSVMEKEPLRLLEVLDILKHSKDRKVKQIVGWSLASLSVNGENNELLRTKGFEIFSFLKTTLDPVVQRKLASFLLNMSYSNENLGHIRNPQMSEAILSFSEELIDPEAKKRCQPVLTLIKNSSYSNNM